MGVCPCCRGQYETNDHMPFTPAQVALCDAAPDLLAACEAAAALLANPGIPTDRAAINNAIDTCRAAIAKAVGK